MKKFKSHAQAEQLKNKYLAQITDLINLVIDANSFLAQPEPPPQENYKSRKLKELEARIEALEQDKAVDKFLLDNSGLMDKLAKQEELNKSTQPSDVGAGVKGVWVTREKLIEAYHKVQGGGMGTSLDALAEQLGLEE